MNSTIDATQDSQAADRIAAFRQRASTPIEVWQPDAGDMLIGELVGWQKAVGTYGESHQILIRDESGHTTATWLTAWLKENLRAQGAEKGDLVAITFLGKKSSPAGRQYNAYALAVEKA